MAIDRLDQSWRVASDGLGLLRVAVVGGIITGVVFRLMGGGGSAPAAVLNVFASAAFLVMQLVALGRWRYVPRESRAGGAADVAWIGAWFEVGATLATVVLVFVLFGGGRARSLEGVAVVVAVVAALGSVLKLLGFLISAYAAARFLERPNLATMAVIVAVLGLIATVIGVVAGAGGLGRGSATGVLVTLALLVITALVLFLVLLSGLQTAIRERRSVAEAFA